MQILILSDSHGRRERVDSVFSRHRDADYAVFLGDGLSDLSDAEARFGIPLFAVSGNCDVFSRLACEVPTERVVTLAGHRILLSHGHRFGVKGGEGALAAFARNEGCGIALFGHTHEPLERYDPDGPLYLFNPGSLAAGNYGLLFLTPDTILFSHGTLFA